MIGTVKKLFKHSAVYGLGSVLNRLIGFILLPLYTRFLTPVDYGISSLLMVTNNVAVALAKMGMGSALFREVIYHGRDEEEVESTALYFLIAEALLVFGLLYLFSDQLSLLLFKSEAEGFLLRLTFLSGFLQMIQTVFMARLRIREQSSLYATISVSRFVVGTVFNILFVAVLQLGVEGLVYATLCTSAIFSLVYLAILVRHLKLTFSFPILRSMLRFGIPLVPGNLAAMIMTSADRYFLQYYSTTAEVGLYSLGYKIGLVMNMLVQAVQLAWPAQKFEIMKDPDAERKFSRILTIYMAGLGFISLGFSVLARELLVIMTTPDYYEAATIVPLVLLSYLFYGVRFMTNIGLIRDNKNEYSSMIIMGTAILNLALNFWLIPPYGMMGAAWSTLISYGVLSLASLIVNQRFWKIPYEYGRILKVALVWAVIYFASLQVSMANLFLDIVVKSLLLVSYPLLLFIIRFYKPEELEKIRQIILSRYEMVRERIKK